MNSQSFKIIIFILILFSVPQLASAKVPDLPKITKENFDQEYQRVVGIYDHIMATTSKLTLKKFRNNKGAKIFRLSRKENHLRQDYKKILEQKRRLDPIKELRDDLESLYIGHHKNKSFDKKALHLESNLIAIELITHTITLRKKYGSFFIPIFHNMMIDVGAKKRGACKHWAEDLLEHMRFLERKFFWVSWGEANAGKFTEHNVAVVIPKDRPFEDGILYDPWRTSGNPFWVKVTEDKHYHWTAWSGFGIL